MGAKSARPASVSLKLAQNFRMISVSYHEASHILIGLLHFILITEAVVIKQKRNVEGHTYYEMMVNDDKYDQLDAKIKNYLIISEVMLKMAGLIGEKILHKQISGQNKFPIVLKIGTEPDTLEAAQLIKKYNLVEPGPKRSQFKAKLARKTMSLLKDHWEDVQLISYALYEKKKLNWDEIKALLLKKSPYKKFWKQQLKDITTLINKLDNDIMIHIVERN